MQGGPQADEERRQASPDNVSGSAFVWLIYPSTPSSVASVNRYDRGRVVEHDCEASFCGRPSVPRDREIKRRSFRRHHVAAMTCVM